MIAPAAMLAVGPRLLSEGGTEAAQFFVANEPTRRSRWNVRGRRNVYLSADMADFSARASCREQSSCVEGSMTRFSSAVFLLSAAGASDTS